MILRDRAYRRFLKQKFNKRIKNKYLQTRNVSLDAKGVGILGKTRKRTQCFCCSSPRKYYRNGFHGLTLGEIKFKISEKEYLDFI